MTTEATPEKEPFDIKAKYMLMYFKNGTKGMLLKQFRGKLRLAWFCLTDPHASASVKNKNFKIITIVPGQPRPEVPQDTQ
ncbi:hypothetical protein KBA73_03665 [Patescibacteria group bacterium]|nr:hypothetical protein [Patescibacteria group bacterium]